MKFWVQIVYLELFNIEPIFLELGKHLVKSPTYSELINVESEVAATNSVKLVNGASMRDTIRVSDTHCIQARVLGRRLTT